MRRVVGFVAVVVLLVVGFQAGVNAGSEGGSTSASDQLPEVHPINPEKLRQLERILDRARALQPSDNCAQGPLSIAEINCKLRELTRFAKATQRELTELGNFAESFIECTQYSPTTRYGNTTAGYVFDPGTGVTYRTSSLDSTHDTATEPYGNFMVLKPTQRCIDFATE